MTLIELQTRELIFRRKRIEELEKENTELKEHIKNLETLEDEKR